VQRACSSTGRSFPPDGAEISTAVISNGAEISTTVYNNISLTVTDL